MTVHELSSGARQSRSLMAVLVLILAVAGTGLLIGGAVSDGAGLGLVALAVPALAAALWVHVNFVATGNPPARVHDVDGGAEIRLRPWWPAATAVVFVAFAFFLASGAFALEGTGIRVACAAVAALLLVPVPELLLAAFRGWRVLLTFEGLRYEGWSVGASLAWDDVVRVESDMRDRNRPGCVIRSTPGAASYESWRRSRILIPLERAPHEGEVVLPSAAFDAPGVLVALIEELARSPEAHREHLLRVVAVPFLATHSQG